VQWWGWKVSDFRFEAWPTEYRLVTQRFGGNPGFYARFGLAGHEGVDLRALAGTRVFVVADGVVRAVYHDVSHAYGLHVRVDHAHGHQTIYAHLSRIDVQAGQTLRAGDPLGLAGNTGNSQGAHLHLTLKRAGAQVSGYPAGVIDPWPYLEPLLERE